LGKPSARVKVANAPLVSGDSGFHGHGPPVFRAKQGMAKSLPRCQVELGMHPDAQTRAQEMPRDAQRRQRGRVWAGCASPPSAPRNRTKWRGLRLKIGRAVSELCVCCAYCVDLPRRRVEAKAMPGSCLCWIPSGERRGLDACEEPRLPPRAAPTQSQRPGKSWTGTATERRWGGQGRRR